MPIPSVLPTPRKIVPGAGAFRLRPEAPIVLPEGSVGSDFFSARALQASIRERAGFSPPIETHARRDDLGPRIELLRRGDAGDGYRVRISRERVLAEGEGAAGLRYAVESLSQLLAPRGRTFPACEIEDAPDLAKRGRDHRNFDLDVLAQSCDGFSGAEIEEAVISGLFEAFSRRSDLDTEIIRTSLEETVPLSRTMSEELGRLRSWAQGRARPATGAESAGRTEMRRKIEL